MSPLDNFLKNLSLNKASAKTSGSTEPTAQEQDETLKKQMGQFSMGLVSIQDIIAPEAIEVDFTYQKINSRYSRTLFISGYPR